MFKCVIIHFEVTAKRMYMKFFRLIVIALIFLFASCGKDGASGIVTDTDVGQVSDGFAVSSEPLVTDRLEDCCTSEQTVTAVSAEERAAEILNKMTLEEKVGQLFLCRNPKSEEQGYELIENCHVGGIIFFGRDFKNSSPKLFAEMLEGYSARTAVPLLTAVDEEGGSVCRASSYRAFRAQRFSSPSELYALGGMEMIAQDAVEKSEFLLELGINFNLAPVADISQNPKDFIFYRTVGLDVSGTAEYVETVVKSMNEKRILSALKHFPGYGNNEDTHTGIAYDKRSLEHLMNNDLVPFMRGIECGAPVIMVSHNIVESIDGTCPASLSEKVMSLLRAELGFEGVIMTDDMSMDAITDFAGGGEAAVVAVLSGADLICSSDPFVQYEAVLEAVKKGEISVERIEESVIRILEMKINYGIIE